MAKRGFAVFASWAIGFGSPNRSPEKKQQMVL
jgi:hypothetical protein